MIVRDKIEYAPVEMTGTAPEVFNLSRNYSFTQITVLGLLSGTCTIEGKAQNSDRFTEVEEGLLHLNVKDTLTISGAYLDAIRITPTVAAPYTLYVVQKV